MHESHRYYTMLYVKYDVVCANRLKHTIYAYDIYIRYRMQYRKERHLTWSRCRRCRSAGPTGQVQTPFPSYWHMKLPQGLTGAVRVRPGRVSPRPLTLGHWGHNAIRDISTDCVSQWDSCLWTTAGGASDCYWCVSCRQCRGSSVSALISKSSCCSTFWNKLYIFFLY